jgi:hypothetical protein
MVKPWGADPGNEVTADDWCVTLTTVTSQLAAMV